MVRDSPGAKESSDAPAMNCDDVREAFSRLIRGGVGLTEWALLDLHMRQCVECQKEWESSYQGPSARQRIAWSRALPRGVSQIVDAIHFGASSFVAWLITLRGLLLIASTVSGREAGRLLVGSRAAATWLVGVPTRVLRLWPMLATRSGRAAAHVMETMGFAIARVADRVIAASRVGATCLVALVIRARRLLLMFSTVSGRAAVNVIGATGLAITRFADVLRRLHGPAISLAIAGRWIARSLSRVFGGAQAFVVRRARLGMRLVASFTVSAVAVSKVTGATCVGIVTRTMEATRAGGRTVLTTSGRALAFRPLLRRRLFSVGTGVVCLAALVASMQFLWPRPWALPERKPVEPAATARLAGPATSTPVSAFRAPAAGAQPESRRATTRPKPPEAAIPAPWRSHDPALARSRAIASTPTPATDATWSRRPEGAPEAARVQDRAGSQNAEALESSAAIDWLLRRSSSQRRIESP
jgi:hypothetical protein